MAILLNVGITTPDEMTKAGNAKARRDLNDLVLDAMRYLDHNREPGCKPFVLELPEGHTAADLDELAKMLRFKGWKVTTQATRLALEIAWPQA